MRKLFLLLALGACRATPGSDDATGDAPSERPYALVLGTAQDGGLPQIGCQEAPCAEARRDPAHARLVTSLLVVDPAHSARFLFDASPDLPLQVERMRGHPSSRAPEGPRPALVEGIFLTHAHMGHYTGLLHLGPEAYGARSMPVYTSVRMAAFLRGNAPWSLLVDTGVIQLVELSPGEPLRLTPNLEVTPIPVPHREEFSDTFAYRIAGPSGSLLYLPDIDKWERWERPVEEVIASVDHALLDGSFFDAGEIPGRDLSEIPHPFIVESLARFAALPASERNKIRFTHLNHTNPACLPDGAAAHRVRAAGMHVARDGEMLGL